jgi:hypothetical protein
MRNETLKNLLLTASLISASAFLTACGDTAKDPVKSQAKIDGEQGKKDPIKSDQKLIEELDELKGASESLDGAAEELKKAVEEELSPAPLPDAPAPSTPLSDFEKFSAAVAGLLPTKVEDKDGIIQYLKPPAIAESMIIGLRDFYRNARGYAKVQELLSIKEASLAVAQKAYDKHQADLAALRTQQEKVSAAFDAVMATDSAADKAKARKAFLKVAPYMLQYEISLKQASDVLRRSADLISEGKEYLAQQVNNINDAVPAFREKLSTSVNDFFTDFSKSTWHSHLDVETLKNLFKVNLELIKQGKLDAFIDKLYPALAEKTISKGNVSEKTVDQTFTDYLASSLDLTAANRELLIKQFKLSIKMALNLEGINEFFPELMPINDGAAPSAAALSAGIVRDISSNVSLRQARTAENGSFNGSNFKMNGVAGQSVELGLPLFVQLKGNVSSAKATEATTGSVAYRLGNTVIGAIQGYANSGAGFGTDSRQLETSVVASHSFGSFFIEGQIGSVSATEVHNSNWSGLRSQVTLGLDTEFVSPFVQLTHRQLDRSGVLDLNETTAYVGLDMEVAKLAADTYSVDTRLLAKAGYGSKDWSAGSKTLGSTAGFSGVVEWSASLNLNSGVAFSSNLALDTTAGSSAGLTVSLDR